MCLRLSVPGQTKCPPHFIIMLRSVRKFVEMSVTVDPISRMYSRSVNCSVSTINFSTKFMKLIFLLSQNLWYKHIAMSQRNPPGYVCGNWCLSTLKAELELDFEHWRLLTPELLLMSIKKTTVFWNLATVLLKSCRKLYTTIYFAKFNLYLCESFFFNPQKVYW